jgi:hypothetical protein
MINTIFAKLPREQITFVTRPEFVNGQEQKFHNALKKSMAKSGMKDPIFIYYQSKRWGDKLKVIVGQNRMTIAEELDIKIIPCIITQFDAENSKLKGQVLKTDEEIKNLFYLPERVVIRRKEGWVYSALCDGESRRTYHELY